MLTKSDFASSPDLLDWNTGYNVTGALGVQIDPMRVEAAVGYQSNGLSTVGGGDVSMAGFEVSMWTVMANAYYDVHINNSGVSPYLMGGIGFASVKNTYPTLTAAQNNTVLAYQAGCGVGIKTTDKVTVDLGYRYLKTDDPIATPASVKYSLGSHNILLGLRVGI